jgi:predicted DNA-binding transcriptional regulator AlpA
MQGFLVAGVELHSPSSGLKSPSLQRLSLGQVRWSTVDGVSEKDTPVVRLAYNQREAAAMLGVSVSTFRRHIRYELPQPKFVGGRLLYRHRDLEAWLNRR